MGVSDSARQECPSGVRDAGPWKHVIDSIGVSTYTFFWDYGTRWICNSADVSKFHWKCRPNELESGNCDALQLKTARDVAPVVLDFNYEVYNAPSAYRFNNSTTSADPECTHTLNFNEVEQLAAELMRFKYTVSQKKGATLSMAITLSILYRFAKFFWSLSGLRN